MEHSLLGVILSYVNNILLLFILNYHVISPSIVNQLVVFFVISIENTKGIVNGVRDLHY